MPILTPQERVGTLLAEKYRLDRVLGQGGFGTVYAGIHEWTNRPIAAKILDQSLSSDEFVRRFLQEARAAAKIEHPNVVQVLDMGKDSDGAVYLVLELLKGEELTQVLRRRGRLPVADTLAYLLPVMDALADAHQRGIIHRDLKPANIFVSIDPMGRTIPKLLDFGIAKDKNDDSMQTRTGQVWGTPSYMSPEQATGHSDVGPPADVWSMGVVLYQTLAGELPFKAASTAEILARILTTRARSLGEVTPDLPPQLVRVLDRALEPDPRHRYADMGAFLGEIVGVAQALDLLPESVREVLDRRELTGRPTLVSGEEPLPSPHVTGPLATPPPAAEAVLAPTAALVTPPPGLVTPAPAFVTQPPTGRPGAWVAALLGGTILALGAAVALVLALRSGDDARAQSTEPAPPPAEAPAPPVLAERVEATEPAPVVEPAPVAEPTPVEEPAPVAEIAPPPDPAPEVPAVEPEAPPRQVIRRPGPRPIERRPPPLQGPRRPPIYDDF